MITYLYYNSIVGISTEFEDIDAVRSREYCLLNHEIMHNSLMREMSFRGSLIILLIANLHFHEDLFL